MKMYIESVAHYLPEERVPNSYFLKVNGLSEEWITTRTGISTRSRAANNEDTNTMAISAVENMYKNRQESLNNIDLIIGASYSPSDTVGTIAHVLQQKFKINNAKAVYISSACSSFINAIEIAEGYFALGKASKALIVASEHNWAYNVETDEKSGHLWGDGAGAMIITKEETKNTIGEIHDVYTLGLGHIGQGPDAVYLKPAKEGLVMPNGRDVFVNACTYMVNSLHIILKRNNLTINDLSYIVPHQANVRIINNIANQLKFNEDNIIKNIDSLGNTGSASTIIGISENIERLKNSKNIGVTVFGGGYSTGALLMSLN